MKKMLQIGAFLCGLLLVQSGFAQYAAPNGGAYQVSECPTQFSDRCPEDHPHPDQPCGDCYCLMVHYEPCYYTTQRCVEEQVPCKKQCVRYVDKYYDCQRCRMVPEYYTETYCQKCPECYEVDDCRPRCFH